MNVKRTLVLLVVCVSVFVLHMLVQELYHRRCRSNLIYVMLYGKSDMCNVMSVFIDKTEFLMKTTITTYANAVSKPLFS